MYIIKIPNNIDIFYNYKKNLLVCQNKLMSKLIKLTVKLIIDIKNKKIIITNNPTIKLSNKQKKKLNSFRGLASFQIKQMLIELTTKYYQKLKFVGIGYRAIKINTINYKNIFLLKLGLSHPLYLSSNNNINLFCLKYTKLFVYGRSFKNLTQSSANIRLTKWPEPYKGKGIIFENEKIKLKEGKKI